MTEKQPLALTQKQVLALAFDPTLLFTYRGWRADPWQCQVLRSRSANHSAAVAATTPTTMESTNSAGW